MRIKLWPSEMLLMHVTSKTWASEAQTTHSVMACLAHKELLYVLIEWWLMQSGRVFFKVQGYTTSPWLPLTIVASSYT